MKKYSFVILCVGLAILIFTQQKLIMPLVMDVVKSDFFLVDNKDQASQLPVSTSLTNFAFLHCNSYIKSELGPDVSITFPKKPLNVWTLGNYHYVVSAEIEAMTETSNTNPIKYVCRIDYDNGENEEGAADIDNWSIEGVDGLDKINES